MNEIERYNFWHLEMGRLELAAHIKELSLSNLSELNKRKKECVEKGLYFDDAVIDKNLHHLNIAEKAIREELALYNVN